MVQVSSRRAGSKALHLGRRGGGLVLNLQGWRTVTQLLADLLCLPYCRNHRFQRKRPRQRTSKAEPVANLEPCTHGSKHDS